MTAACENHVQLIIRTNSHIKVKCDKHNRKKTLCVELYKGVQG